MVPLNMEDEMRSRLESRNLKPSSESWKRLEDRLDQESPARPRRNLWWVGVAASLVGIMLIALLTRQGDEIDQNQPIIVETEETTPTNESKNDLREIESTEFKEQDRSNENVAVSNTKEDTKPIDSDKPRSSNPVKKAVSAIAVASEEVNKNPIDDLKLDPKKEAEKQIEEKIVIDAIAEVDKKKLDDKSVGEAELDALLITAASGIAGTTTKSDKTKAVDPTALLKEVEEDLDESFRNRVFKALVTGYESVKTVVVERNN